MTIKRTFWPLLAVLFWCCGDEVLEPEIPVAPPDELKVFLTVVPDSIHPGDTATVTARAELPDTLILTEFDLRIGGLLPDTVVDPPIRSSGGLEIRLFIRPPTGPIEGTIRFALLASSGQEADSAHAALVINDDGPPVLSVAADSLIDPPDSMIVVTYRAEDASGIRMLRLQADGAVQLDTVIWFDYDETVDGTLSLVLPHGTGPGDSVTINATARDGFGTEVSEQRMTRILDETPPTVAFNVRTVFHPEFGATASRLTFVPGDTIRIDGVASDNHSLTTLGYRWLSLADSIVPGSPGDSFHFEFEIPAGTNDGYAYVHVFATDSSSNVGAVEVHTAVVDGKLRPISTVDPHGTSLTYWDQQGNYALDRERDVLYVADALPQLHVVSLASRTEQALDFGSNVRSVDLLPGGDSIAVAVPGEPDLLLIWDIEHGPTAIDTITLNFPSGCDVWDIQVAQNRHVLATAWTQTGCPTIDVDLDSRSQRFRDVPAALRNLEQSGDDRTIVAWNQDEAMMYWSDSDSLGSVVHLFTSVFTYVDHAGPSLDHTGNTVLVRNRVYDAQLSAYRWILPDPGDNPRAHALSADGRFAYICNWPGYWKVDVATGEVIEKVFLPQYPARILAHPDGQRLIVFGHLWLGIVDLRDPLGSHP